MSLLTALSRPVTHRLAQRMLRFGDEQASQFRLEPEAGRQYLLYVHVPYCESLCPYCSFHRVRYNPDSAADYFLALRREIEYYAAAGFQFREVYVGGGTPTVNLPELVRTLRLVHDRFDIEAVSVETNPNHLHAEVTGPLLDAGVKRLSVGVQSFDDSLLDRMGRLTPYGSGGDIAQRLSQVADTFDTVNVDMIFNLPGQNEAMLARDLKQLLDTGVGQVSYYPLMVADSSEKHIRREMGSFSLAAEEQLYLMILDTLRVTHPPSSVWCFSKDANQIDEYIINFPEFVGVGSGAFSYLNGVFYANSFSILRYDQLPDGQHPGITRARSMSRFEQYLCFLLTSLFGLSLDTNACIGNFADIPGAGSMPRLLQLAGLARKEGGNLKLTDRGMYFMLVNMSEFLVGVNNFRDQMRAHITEEYEASYGEHVIRMPEVSTR